MSTGGYAKQRKIAAARTPSQSSGKKNRKQKSVPSTENKGCPKCGERFEPNRMGRPRRFCRLCTPRKPEDIAEADERFWREQAVETNERNRRTRKQMREYRETINRNRAKAGLPPIH